MRTSPDAFVPALRAQWLACIMHDILGMKTLSGASALLSGYRSITRHPALGSARIALRNLRLIGMNIESDAHLQEAVMEARVWEEDHASDDDYREPPFEISTDPATGFTIRERVRASDPRRQNMLQELLRSLPQEAEKRAAADHTRPFRFRADGDNSPDAICDTRDIQVLRPKLPVAPDKHERDPIAITLADLEAIAKALDEEDSRDPTRPPRNFLTRLRSVEGDPVFSVLSPQGNRLAPNSTIKLDGVSHMIGLPGAGKSTLIFLLIVALARQGRRVTLLVPSIEFALAIDADLARYSVPTALLVGQSPDARRSHATRLAERIATMDSGGFGQTAAGAELLGTRCALSGFVSVPPPSFDFPHDRPPCTSIRQAKLKKDGKEGQEGKRLCPLATSCGRQRSARRLADAEALVHIGHVISTDVSVSPHFHAERMRHFERVARTSDLVIIDEVDGAQAALDGKESPNWISSARPNPTDRCFSTTYSTPSPPDAGSGFPLRLRTTRWRPIVSCVSTGPCAPICWNEWPKRAEFWRGSRTPSSRAIRSSRRCTSVRKPMRTSIEAPVSTASGVFSNSWYVRSSPTRWGRRRGRSDRAQPRTGGAGPGGRPGRARRGRR